MDARIQTCNYDASATNDDGSCTYADEFYETMGVTTCLNDTDGDGVLDESKFKGARIQQHATTMQVLRTTTDA